MTRTLKDYRPQHDEDCRSYWCQTCGFHAEHRAHGKLIIGLNHEFIPVACTCGLDALIETEDAASLEPASALRSAAQEHDSHSSSPLVIERIRREDEQKEDHGGTRLTAGDSVSVSVHAPRKD